MNNLAEIVSQQADISDNAWEGAIDDATRENDRFAREAYETQRSTCAYHYRRAVEAIENNDLETAENELLECNSLESDAGDNGTAHHALKAVRAALVG